MESMGGAKWMEMFVSGRTLLYYTVVRYNDIIVSDLVSTLQGTTARTSRTLSFPITYVQHAYVILPYVDPIS